MCSGVAKLKSVAFMHSAPSSHQSRERLIDAISGAVLRLGIDDDPVHRCETTLQV